MNGIRRWLILSGLVVSASDVAAQAYPVRPIRIVVTLASGGGVDTSARIVGQRTPTVRVGFHNRVRDGGGPHRQARGAHPHVERRDPRVMHPPQQRRDRPDQPCALIGLAFAAMGFTATTYMRGWADMDLVTTGMMPLFLFSATYLMTVFPDARVRFFGEVPADQLFDGWQHLDFIFIPDTFHHVVRPERVDLTINMVSFQEMTDGQVRAYADMAADAGCPGARDHGIQLILKVRKIQMTVAVDQHGLSLLPRRRPARCSAGTPAPEAAAACPA